MTKVRSADDLRNGHWSGSACTTADEVQNVLRVRHDIWSVGQQPDLSNLSRPTGQFARDQSNGGRHGGSCGFSTELYDRGEQPICEKELFLPGFTERVSDFPI